MGKRELFLVLGFVVLGTVLYQATAPTSPSGGGFSFGEMFREVRREMGDANATRELTRDAHVVASASAEVVQVPDLRGRIHVRPVDGDDVRLSTTLTLRGLDDQDLDRQAEGVAIALVADGPVIALDVRSGEGGRQPEQSLTLEVPRRLRLELGGRGVADVRGIAGLDLDDFRGDVTAEDLQGPATGSHREGRLELGPGLHVQIETRRSTLRLVRPASASLDLEASDVEVMDAEGPVSIAQERCTLEVLGGTAPVTVSGEGGTLKLRDVRSPVHIDAERLTVSLIMREPAPVTLAIEADDVDVTLPPGGLSLEARVESGELRVPDGVASTQDGDVQQASATFDGGGPHVALAVTRGTLTVR